MMMQIQKLKQEVSSRDENIEQLEKRIESKSAQIALLEQQCSQLGNELKRYIVKKSLHLT